MSKEWNLPPPINQFPEFGLLLQYLVLGHGELGAEKEILERVFVQDAVDQQARLDTLKINPVVLGAVTVQIALLAMELAEFIGIGLVEVLGQEIEFAENLQLQHLGQLGDFGGAAVVEDDLEHGGKGRSEKEEGGNEKLLFLNCQSRSWDGRRKGDRVVAPAERRPVPAATR